MTPAARVQAAIEILDAVAEAAREGGPPADRIVADALRQRRYAGSKDRRAIRELVYAAIRAVAETPPSGRAAMLTLAARDGQVAALFDGSGYGPAAIDAGEKLAITGDCPAWLREYLDPLLDDAEVASLLDRAPLDLRANRLKGDRDDLARHFPGGTAIAALADGWRLPAESPALQDATHAGGLFEIQDAASQHAALALDAVADMLIVDLCAGAGGKTLAIAAASGDAARIVACDTNRARLQQLPPRAARAGVRSIETRLLDPGREAAALADLRGQADRVIVDAPCSGTGTWRRSPELRWRLTPARLTRHVAEQAALLRLGATLVRPGGAMVYAVCSVVAAEGRAQVAAFLSEKLGWSADSGLLPPAVGRAAGEGMLLSPAHDATDGFFLARLRAPC